VFAKFLIYLSKFNIAKAEEIKIKIIADRRNYHSSYKVQYQNLKMLETLTFYKCGTIFNFKQLTKDEAMCS